MYVADHVADAIQFDRVRVTSAIVKEMSNVSNGFLGAIGFGGGVFIDCMKHGVVQGACNVEEFTGDFSKELDPGRCHGGSTINFCHLLFGTVVRRRVA